MQWSKLGRHALQWGKQFHERSGLPHERSAWVFARPQNVVLFTRLDQVTGYLIKLVCFVNSNLLFQGEPRQTIRMLVVPQWWWQGLLLILDEASPASCPARGCEVDVDTSRIANQTFHMLQMRRIQQIQFDNRAVQALGKLSISPKARRLAVRRAVPAYISIAKNWPTGCPRRWVFGVKHSLAQRWSCNEWCLKHPGSAQTCNPLEQVSPGLAALHPFGKLKPQHNLFFCGVSRAFPMRAEGTLGPLTPFFDLPFPLPLFFGWGLVGVLDLFLSVAGALLDELALLADPDKGNKWKATVG